MQAFLIAVLWSLFVVGGLGAAESVPANTTEVEARMTPERLDALIADLDNEARRLAALEDLIDFASYRIFQVGSVMLMAPDLTTDEMWRRATAAVAAYHDDETLFAAIGSDSATLQFWGLFKLVGSARTRLADADTVDIVLRIQDLATNGTPIVRSKAHTVLARLPDQRAFLVERLENETHLGNVFRLLQFLSGREYKVHMRQRLLAMLEDTKNEPRRDALRFLAGSQHAAPMWQVAIDESVFHHILTLSASDDDELRSIATWALQAAQSEHPQPTRQRALELVTDATAAVRWQAVVLLRADKELPEVRVVLEGLLGDDAPIVRYMSIGALGYEQYLPELRELADGDDPRVAQMAHEVLRRLAQQADPTPQSGE